MVAVQTSVGADTVWGRREPNQLRGIRELPLTELERSTGGVGLRVGENFDFA